MVCITEPPANIASKMGETSTMSETEDSQEVPRVDAIRPAVEPGSNIVEVSV